MEKDIADIKYMCNSISDKELQKITRILDVIDRIEKLR